MRIAGIRRRLGDDALRSGISREWWARGNLRPILRRGAQSEAYEFVHRVHDRDRNSAAPIVLNIHRGGTKTFLLTILAWERCLSRPYQSVFLIGPTHRQNLAITEEAVRFLLSRSPRDLRPQKSEGHVYTFRNPEWRDPDATSTLRILGAKEDAAHLRGFRANAVFLDELALFDEPDYVIRDVITPFFSGRTDPLFVVASTPPRTTGHYFSATLIPQALRTGRYLTIPASRNPAFTADEEEKMLSVFGSKESSAWRREMECELIGDEGSLAVPSFSRKKAALVREWPRPAYFYPFLFADIGYVDATAVLFAYIDFEAQKLVIEDEIVATQMGTRAISEAVKAKEKALFGKATLSQLTRRWADATPRELDDLRQDGLYFSPARTGEEKWEKWSGIARLESLCRDERVAIHPRCRHLIFQLENAVKNLHHTDLERIPFQEGEDPTSPIVGHWDALMALAYGAFQIRPYWLQNPFPAFEPVRGQHAIVPRHASTAFREDSSHITCRPVTLTSYAGHIGPRERRSQARGRNYLMTGGGIPLGHRQRRR